MEPEQSTHSRQIYLLGALRVYQGGNLRPLSGEKSLSLLAYLALNPRLPQRREKLADLLFIDAPFDRVRRNFSDTLYRLQKALGGDWLILEGDTVSLRMDEQLWVDVWQFERLAASDQEMELHEAVELYAGDLLPELYDDWLIAERELRRNQYLAVLEKLAALQEARGDLRQALLTLRRLVSAEPLHEPAHQSYLRVLGRLQRYGEALAHYEYLRTLLRSELDSEPLAETRLIAQAIEHERHLGTIQAEVVERTPFVGRKTERLKVLTAVEAMLKGQGGIIAIEGEAGIGKSRLLREIADSIRWRGATLLQGQASETPSASPFSPLTEALVPLLSSPRRVQLEALLTEDTLAALAPLNPTWKGKVELVELPPELTSSRYQKALEHFGQALAQLTPVVLVLDDLHWASSALWKSLEVFAQSLSRNGALIIVIYRRPEIEHSPGWEVIQAWDRLGLLKSITLQPLNVDEVAQLVDQTRSADPAEVYVWTGGNPFYLTEWLAVHKSDTHSRLTVTAHRLHMLSPNARSALESACILGENIPYRLWTEVSGLPPLNLAGLSDELVIHSWLQPSTYGFAFAHDLIRRSVYDKIEPSHRRHMHERAAQAYHIFEPDNFRARAFHLDQAGHADEAVQAYRLASRQDQSRLALNEAKQSLERALSLMPSVPTLERVEINLEKINLCDITGDLQGKQTALEAALSGARQLENDDLRCQALLAAGRAAEDAGEIEQAEPHLKAALTLAQQIGDIQREAEVLYFYTVFIAHQGKWNEALAMAFQALEKARSVESRFIEGKTLRAIGITKSELEHPAEAILWQEQSVEVFRSIGQGYQMWISQLNLMALYNELGMWDRSLETARELIASLDASGAWLHAANVRLNLTDVHVATGNPAAARQAIQEILDRGNPFGARGITVVKHNLGLIAEAEGKYSEAKAYYLEALEFAQASQASDFVASAQHELGALLVHLGSPQEAIPLLESAFTFRQEDGTLLSRLNSAVSLGLALLETGERSRAETLADDSWNAFLNNVPIGDGYMEWLWALYRLLVGVDRVAQANDVLQAANTELQRQQKYITDPELRRNFYERVPIHRAIVAANDRHNQIARDINVSLAHRSAPLGRHLRENEFVTVHWTVDAPEDDAITDKTARRQYRLKRLLQQAESQDAAPTDEDLAKALGVSRRTILRDMQELAQEIPIPPTRKRKS